MPKRPPRLTTPTANEQTTRKFAREVGKLVRAMLASYRHWLAIEYKLASRANKNAGTLPSKLLTQRATTLARALLSPVNARTATPQPQPIHTAHTEQKTDALFDRLTTLRDYWRDDFQKKAPVIVSSIADDWYHENARGWSTRLARSGFDVEMQLTPAQRTILDVKIRENVALINTIPEKFHADVEGIVSRNFLAGRDLAAMSEQIAARGNVTLGRAAFIAHDQANQVSAQMNSARQQELGISWAVWRHSAAGREPRYNHVRAGREQWVFNTQVGIDFGDGFGHVLPGQAIRCGCQSQSIIPDIGRGDIRSVADLEPVAGFPGAYRAKPGRSAGTPQPQDVTNTRVTPTTPVKYS